MAYYIEEFIKRPSFLCKYEDLYIEVCRDEYVGTSAYLVWRDTGNRLIVKCDDVLHVYNFFGTYDYVWHDCYSQCACFMHCEKCDVLGHPLLHAIDEINQKVIALKDARRAQRKSMFRFFKN